MGVSGCGKSSLGAALAATPDPAEALTLDIALSPAALEAAGDAYFEGVHA